MAGAVPASGPLGAGALGRLGAIEPAWLLVGLITLAAAALRLDQIHRVVGDPFYDAAVRSMAASLHNFFFGAYEPGGSVSIDKPPLDLWLQVAAVKVLGFNDTSLKLPQAIAGTFAVPVLFAAVRRPFGDRAALAAAAALAVLPISVLTARSDTMDSVMMFLLVGALALLVRSAGTGRAGPLYGAGALLGLAFNVKLLEALIALPALVALPLLGLPWPWRRRLAHLLGAGALLAAVATSWLLATLAFPPHDRPFAIGSTNGSAWNAAFVFNGYDRVARPARVDTDPATSARRRAADQRLAGSDSDVVLDHIPINAAGPLRLFDRAGPLSGRRLGYLLAAALALGLPALALIARAGRREAAESRAAPRRGPPFRARPAASLALAAWLLIGVALFSAMSRLHPRYVEAFTPAVAACLGIGLAWAARRAGWWLLVSVLGLAAYAHYLHGSVRAVDVVALAAGGAAAVTAIVAQREGAARGGALALAVASVLALPVTVSVGIVRDAANDSGHVGYTAAGPLARLSRYLRDHRGGARYEVAAASATQVGSLIVKDALPVLVLTTYDGRVVTTVGALQRAVATGQVRYALLGSRCRAHQRAFLAQCSAPALWAAAHGTDVSRDAGQAHSGVLLRLSGA